MSLENLARFAGDSLTRQNGLCEAWIFLRVQTFRARATLAQDTFTHRQADEFVYIRTAEIKNGRNSQCERYTTLTQIDSRRFVTGLVVYNSDISGFSVEQSLSMCTHTDSTHCTVCAALVALALTELQ